MRFHNHDGIQIGNLSSSRKVSIPDNDVCCGVAYAVRMDRIGSKKPLRWFLPEWRNHFNLTQEQLAERIGTGKGQISKLETGAQRFNDKWIALCAEGLNIEPGDLLRDPKADDVRSLLLKAPEEIRDLLAAPEEVRERALKVISTLLKAG